MRIVCPGDSQNSDSKDRKQPVISTQGAIVHDSDVRN